MEGFDWEFNAKGVDRRSIEQLMTCDFVRRHENVILVGQTGLGKSRILQSVGHAACHPGIPGAVRDQRQAAAGIHRGAWPTGASRPMLDEYARFDLLLIDEFGFDRLEREARAQGQHTSITACWTPARAGVRRHWRPISTSERGPITWATRCWRVPFSTGWWTAR